MSSYVLSRAVLVALCVLVCGVEGRELVRKVPKVSMQSDATMKSSGKALQRDVGVQRSRPMPRTTHQTVEPRTALSEDSRTRNVLYVIWTTKKFYNKRIRWGLETWAKDLNDMELVIIGDARAAEINETQCPLGYGVGQCCKTAEAVIAAQKMIRQNPSLEWVFFADDDVFIRTDAVEASLLAHSQALPQDQGQALASSFLCSTDTCQDRLCGGGGLALNRKAIEMLVGSDPQGFREEQMRKCKQCRNFRDVSGRSHGLFSDIALGDIIKDRKITETIWHGLYSWKLDKPCFDASLVSKDPPLTYHPMRTSAHFQMLYRIFQARANQSVTPQNVNASQDCVAYNGHVHCSDGHAERDRPWTLKPNICTVFEFEQKIIQDYQADQEHARQRHKWQLVGVTVLASVSILAVLLQRSAATSSVEAARGGSKEALLRNAHTESEA